jgi:type IV pilus assembly protein PilA
MLKLLKKRLKNEKGLTLIELLVVIVILGIIAAIAVVSIGGIVGETEDKAVVTEAVQIINAAKLAHASDGNIPTGGYNATNLQDYISNVSDTGNWSVTRNASNEYVIDGHGVEAINGIDENTAGAVTERELTDYLDGE